MALIVLGAFFPQQLAWSAPRPVYSVERIADRDPLASNLGIPESIATIDDVFDARAHRLIYLIQDAHTNESAQINIAKTLELLIEKEGIKYVFLEAGEGDVSLSFLRDSAPLEKRKRVGMSFLRKGFLQGSEYLDLTSDKKFKLWGIENRELYEKSIRIYRNITAKRKKARQYLARIESALNALKPKIFNPELQAFDHVRTQYLESEFSLTDYIDVLMQKISFDNFPNLKQLSQIKELEESIDFTLASHEQVRALESLSNEEQTLLKHYQPLTKFSHDNLQHKIAFYILLQEKLRLTTHDSRLTTAYPHLTQYLIYLNYLRFLDTKTLLLELDTLEEEILNTLIQTKEERFTLKLAKNIRILKKLLEFQATPDEFAHYEQNFDSFDVTFITGYLNYLIMNQEAHYEKTLLLDKDFNGIILQAAEFYRLTQARDQVFIQNTLHQMELKNFKKAILITGGYHTSNLKESLKEQKISYVSLAPQILHPTDHQRYERLLTNQRLSSDKNSQLASHNKAHHHNLLAFNKASLIPVSDEAKNNYELGRFPQSHLANLAHQLDEEWVGIAEVVIGSRTVSGSQSIEKTLRSSSLIQSYLESSNKRGRVPLRRLAQILAKHKNQFNALSWDRRGDFGKALMLVEGIFENAKKHGIELPHLEDAYDNERLPHIIASTLLTVADENRALSTSRPVRDDSPVPQHIVKKTWFQRMGDSLRESRAGRIAIALVAALGLSGEPTLEPKAASGQELVQTADQDQQANLPAVKGISLHEINSMKNGEVKVVKTPHGLFYAVRDEKGQVHFVNPSLSFVVNSYWPLISNAGQLYGNYFKRLLEPMDVNPDPERYEEPPLRAQYLKDLGGNTLIIPMSPQNSSFFYQTGEFNSSEFKLIKDMHEEYGFRFLIVYSAGIDMVSDFARSYVLKRGGIRTESRYFMMRKPDVFDLKTNAFGPSGEMIAKRAEELARFTSLSKNGEILGVIFGGYPGDSLFIKDAYNDKDLYVFDATKPGRIIRMDYETHLAFMVKLAERYRAIDGKRPFHIGLGPIEEHQIQKMHGVGYEKVFDAAYLWGPDKPLEAQETGEIAPRPTSAQVKEKYDLYLSQASQLGLPLSFAPWSDLALAQDAVQSAVMAQVAPSLADRMLGGNANLDHRILLGQSIPLLPLDRNAWGDYWRPHVSLFQGEYGWQQMPPRTPNGQPWRQRTERYTPKTGAEVIGDVYGKAGERFEEVVSSYKSVKPIVLAEPQAPFGTFVIQIPEANKDMWGQDVVVALGNTNDPNANVSVVRIDERGNGVIDFERPGDFKNLQQSADDPEFKINQVTLATGDDARHLWGEAGRDFNPYRGFGFEVSRPAGHSVTVEFVDDMMSDPGISITPDGTFRFKVANPEAWGQEAMFYFVLEGHEPGRPENLVRLPVGTNGLVSINLKELRDMSPDERRQRNIQVLNLNFQDTDKIGAATMLTHTGAFGKFGAGLIDIENPFMTVEYSPEGDPDSYPLDPAVTWAVREFSEPVDSRGTFHITVTNTKIFGQEVFLRFLTTGNKNKSGTKENLVRVRIPADGKLDLKLTDPALHVIEPNLDDTINDVAIVSGPAFDENDLKTFRKPNFTAGYTPPPQPEPVPAQSQVAQTPEPEAGGEGSPIVVIWGLGTAAVILVGAGLGFGAWWLLKKPKKTTKPTTKAEPVKSHRQKLIEVIATQFGLVHQDFKKLASKTVSPQDQSEALKAIPQRLTIIESRLRSLSENIPISDKPLLQKYIALYQGYEALLAYRSMDRKPKRDTVQSVSDRLSRAAGALQRLHQQHGSIFDSNELSAIQDFSNVHLRLDRALTAAEQPKPHMKRPETQEGRPGEPHKKSKSSTPKRADEGGEKSGARLSEVRPQLVKFFTAVALTFSTLLASSAYAENPKPIAFYQQPQEVTVEGRSMKYEVGQVEIFDIKTNEEAGKRITTFIATKSATSPVVVRHDEARKARQKARRVEKQVGQDRLFDAAEEASDRMAAAWQNGLGALPEDMSTLPPLRFTVDLTEVNSRTKMETLKFWLPKVYDEITRRGGQMDVVLPDSGMPLRVSGGYVFLESEAPQAAPGTLVIDLIADSTKVNSQHLTIGYQDGEENSSPLYGPYMLLGAGLAPVTAGHIQGNTVNWSTIAPDSFTERQVGAVKRFSGVSQVTSRDVYLFVSGNTDFFNRLRLVLPSELVAVGVLAFRLAKQFVDTSV